MSRAFVFSGYECSETKACLARLIADLGGVYLEVEKEDIPLECTHLIATPLCRSPKCLCASAAGLWILPESYVLDSHKAGNWLSEEKYEWTSESLSQYYEPEVCKLIGSAARRNRMLVAETNRKRFFGWKCLFYYNKPSRLDPYKRILKSGDADLLTEKDNLTQITHVFTDRESLKAAKRIIKSSCHFLSLDYLRNYLFRDIIPEVSEFSVRTYSPSMDPLGRMRPKLGTNRTALVSQRLTIDIDPTETERYQGRPEKKVKTKHKRWCNNNTFETESMSQVNYYVSTHTHQIVTQEICRHPKVQSLKRMSWGVDTQTMSQIMPRQQDEVDKSEMPHTVVNMFETWRQDNWKLDELSSNNAIDFLQNNMFQKFYYPHSTLVALFDLVLQTEKRFSLYKALSCLSKFIKSQPPTTPNVSKAYLEAFSRKDENSQMRYSDILRNCLFSDITHYETVFWFFVQTLEVNFKSFLSKVVDPSKELIDVEFCPLICHVYWPDLKVGSVNKNCQDLFQILIQALNNTTHLSIVQRLLHLVLECVRLSKVSNLNQREESIYSNTCKTFITELVKTFDATYKTSETSRLLKKFLNTLKPVWCKLLISKYLIDRMRGFRGKKTNKEVLSLNNIVSCYMFSKVPKSNGSGRRTKQGRIMTASDGDEKAPGVNSQNRKGETELHGACMKNDVEKMRSLLQTPGIDVNLKDHAGWTPLHEACNRGYVECVKLLLKWKPPSSCFRTRGATNPGPFVDINAKSKDSGVTSLHDAVCGDHHEVVKLLLKYGGRSLLEEKDKKGNIPMDYVQSLSMEKILKSSPVTEDEGSADDEEDNLPSPSAGSSTIANNTPKDWTDFLFYFTCLASSFITWNSLREFYEAWIKFQRYYKEINHILVRDIYKTLHGCAPASEKIVSTLCDDLKLIPVLPEKLMELEVFFEKLTKKKKCFSKEFFALETMLCFEKNNTTS